MLEYFTLRELLTGKSGAKPPEQTTTVTKALLSTSLILYHIQSVLPVTQSNSSYKSILPSFVSFEYKKILSSLSTEPVYNALFWVCSWCHQQ